jgi:Protein of unknown function (DUF1203)
MHYRISGLPAEPFQNLFGLDDAALAAAGARRMLADAPHAFPCRIGLSDAEPGERVLLLNYEHQPANTPFRANGPIFVREAAYETAAFTDEIPDQFRRRPLSVRAYDSEGMMIDADICDGAALEPLIARLFENADAAYLHVHFARRGCYAGRVDRV